MMKALQSVLWLSGLALLLGCSGAQPLVYHADTEIPRGPGLLTGECGSTTITLGNRFSRPL